jgi:hypothetical protein
VAIIVGASVAAAAVVWCILFFGYLKNRAPQRGLAYFLILCVWLMALDAGIAGLAHYSGQRRAAQARQQDAALLKQVIGELAEADDASTLRHYSVAHLHTGAPGEAGRLARAAIQHMTDVAKASDACRAEYLSSDFPFTTTPQSLATTAGLAKAEASVATLHAALKDCDSRIVAAHTAYRSMLAGARIPPTLKTQALAHFDRVMAQDRADRQHEMSLAAALLDEEAAMLRDLRRSWGEWEVTGQTFLFRDPQALARQQRHIERIIADGRRLHDLAK